MTVQSVHTAASVGIPDFRCLVKRPGDDFVTAERCGRIYQLTVSLVEHWCNFLSSPNRIIKSDCKHNISVSTQHQHLVARLDIPHAARPIVAARYAACARLIECHIRERQNVRSHRATMVECFVQRLSEFRQQTLQHRSQVAGVFGADFVFGTEACTNFHNI